MKKNPLIFLILGLFSVNLLAGSIPHQWRGWTFKLSCASKISCAHERMTYELLKGLILQYNVKPWIRTRVINIQEGVASHSSPLTLNTSYNLDRLCLLSVFLHEQIHLLESDHRARFHKAMAEFKSYFPKLPPSLSSDPVKAYRHFIVVYFEFKALETLLGTSQAKNVLSRKPRYAWIHMMIYRHQPLFARICRDHGLGFRI